MNFGILFKFSTYICAYILIVGPSVGWVERYARVSNLEIWHRVLVCHDSSYGYLELADRRVEVRFAFIA